LVKVRQSYAEITATQRRLAKQKEQADAIASDWYKRAQLALEKGNEELAREALKRRQVAVDQGASLQLQLDSQTAAIDKLYEGMQVLERNILDAKGKKEQMVARARTAQSTQKVNDMLSGVTGKTSMDAFKRMEEKVEALEAAAEVAAEMGSTQTGLALAGSSAMSLEQEFKRLEASSSVDDELQKMKGLLKGSAEPASSSSSSSYRPSATSSPAVEDELEKLKRDAGL
jgi:phage shock protein A